MHLEAVCFQMALDALEIMKSVAEIVIGYAELTNKDFSQNIEPGYSVRQHNWQALVARHFLNSFRYEVASYASSNGQASCSTRIILSRLGHYSLGFTPTFVSVSFMVH